MDADQLGSNSKFDVLCEDAYGGEYLGQSKCAYNVARSLAEAQKRLSDEVSDQTWGNLHNRQYENLPWSKTPLRPIFHREIPHGGNGNTPNVA